MNFLELCRLCVQELGVNGLTGPATVVNQRGTLLKIVNWAAMADLYVAGLHNTWRFMWRKYERTLAATSNIPTMPGPAVKRWSKRFFLNQDQLDWSELLYCPYREFRGLHDVGVIRTVRPAIITERPDRRLLLNTFADQPYTITGEFWVRPRLMSADDATPNVPEDFFRVLTARVKIEYGNSEDAPELIAAGEAEYADQLEKLEQSELEGVEEEGGSVGNEEGLAMEIP